jgi:Ca-activated chloride channel family protein
MRPSFGVVAAAVAVAGVSSAAIAAQTFQAGVEIVRVPVVVTARHGALVSGLEARDFEVRDGGQARPIVFFADAAREAASDAVPLHVGLLFDKSESMEDDLDAAAQAAALFVSRMDEAADVTLVAFDTGVRSSRFSPADYPRLFDRLRDRHTGAATRLYDALWSYAAGTERRPGLHVLVLFTDGGDSRSTRSLGDVVEVLRRGNVLVYALGYLEHQGPARLSQQMLLTRIAEQTGGRAFFPGSMKDVRAAYETILGELHGRYTLGIEPLPSDEPGAFHSLAVRVTRPDLEGVRVRARSGYSR